MTGTFLLGAVLGITLRQIRRLRRALLADPVDRHDHSWCACNIGDDPAPCLSALHIDGVKTCTLTRGHGGLHQHGGWCWTDSLADEAAA